MNDRSNTPAPVQQKRGDIIKAMAQAMVDADGPDGPSYEHLAEAALRAITANGLIVREVHESLMDSQYVAGAKAGWNAAQLPDSEAKEKIAQLMRLEPGTLAALHTPAPGTREVGT